MLNLLKFKRSADSGAGSGAAAYGRYGDVVQKMVAAQGGSIVWIGQPRHVFIGDPEADDWDVAVLVSYPSRQAFIEMVSTPDYADAHTHREDGLERTIVLACAPATLPTLE